MIYYSNSVGYTREGIWHDMLRVRFQIAVYYYENADQLEGTIATTMNSKKKGDRICLPVIGL